jgi:hypothetical protein
MRNGRTSWTTKAPAETLRRAMEAVDARADTVRAIYDRLNLERFVRFATFERWARIRRRDRERRMGFGFNQTGVDPCAVEPAEIQTPNSESDADAGGTPVGRMAPSVELVMAQCAAAISEAMAAGRIGKLDVGKALRSLVSLKELSIAEAADKRAAEKHAAWVRDDRAKQNIALEAVSKSSQLTPEQVAEIRLKVLGL